MVRPKATMTILLAHAKKQNWIGDSANRAAVRLGTSLIGRGPTPEVRIPRNKKIRNFPANRVTDFARGPLRRRE